MTTSTLLPAAFRHTLLLLMSVVASTALAEEATVAEASVAEKTVPLELAEGRLTVAAPGGWKKVPPRNRIIEAEFSVPAGAEASAGRLTIMAAGGSVDANIDRWIGQFRETTGEPKIEKEDVAGMKLTVLDVAGTYLESMRGPFGPKTEKPGRRMIAAILETGDLGNYFFKLVGESGVIEKNADAFKAMVMSAAKAEGP